MPSLHRQRAPLAIWKGRLCAVCLLPFFALSCERTSAVHLRQKLPGSHPLEEKITLHLIDADPLPEREWQAEADRLALLRKQQNRCRDWNNEGVYRALIELRQPQNAKQIPQALPILEKAVRLCKRSIVDENYRAVFYLNGRKSASSEKGL